MVDSYYYRHFGFWNWTYMWLTACFVKALLMIIEITWNIYYL